MEELTEQEVCIKLNRMYEESEDRVKTDAIVNRAYIDKISSDTISEKVSAQMNAIRVGIHEINPRFKEGSKNYETTKELVATTLANYEHALIELSKFYDGKIEQLILRKVELEASLVGALINEEYLYQKILKKNEQKDNDKIKKSLKENIKLAIEKIKNRKKENTVIDPTMISKLMDGQDVVGELEQNNSKQVDKAIEDKKNNKEFIEKTEKEISLINGEIQRINDRKKKSIYDAMEIGDKSLTNNIRKPRIFKKITRFFISRFNTAKIVESTIIDPLNLRIESFKNNELANMKG